MITVELPYPPSINHYWRHVGPKTLISREGRQYRQDVEAILAAEGVKPVAGRLGVSIDLYVPDRRQRDLDNVLKALLDALEGVAYEDDGRIDELSIKRSGRAAGGLVRVQIWRLPAVAGVDE